ncbi:hypothetical protein [Gimesia sp.]|uniref:hypothetical protein n=1 Tax=Gimesia sp. TaxID=2024833 RepID=UPI000C6905DE|nr:hypothetical protein [Gimesia sp.]MAX36202.1 hypothetical protein [Gimesia sp.]HAH46642.1 hypothetical protein [Planctomycetaceae bacterium]HBL45527.1 hypothetical protein [Planctomycetaceae bacterium]|tara:strand:+ start:2344 stop:2847 length:504 start_codon:yes stop_codon:yes gene_type:complete
MNLTDRKPTFIRWYQSFMAIPRMPYIAFMVAAVIATSIVLMVLMLAGSTFTSILLFLFAPLWLPVVAGDLALMYWIEKERPFRPSLVLRLLILTLIMEGVYHFNHYVNPPAKPPHSSIYEETMNQVLFMSLWGAQCVLLFILEPGLRWWQRWRLGDKTDSFFSHPLS